MFASFLHAHHQELSGDASSAIAAYESLVATSTTHPYDDAQIPTTSEPPSPLLLSSSPLQHGGGMQQAALAPGSAAGKSGRSTKAGKGKYSTTSRRITFMIL